MEREKWSLSERPWTKALAGNNRPFTTWAWLKKAFYCNNYYYLNEAFNKWIMSTVRIGRFFGGSLNAPSRRHECACAWNEKRKNFKGKPVRRKRRFQFEFRVRRVETEKIIIINTETFVPEKRFRVF